MITENQAFVYNIPVGFSPLFFLAYYIIKKYQIYAVFWQLEKGETMENWTSYQNRTYNNDVCKLLIYFLKNYKINNAIDLGCGSGNETVYMIKNGVKVEAIDRQLNKEFILNRLNDKEKEKISFLEQEFESIEQMENYIKDIKYTANEDGLICFGLRFSYDSKTKKYDYSLHFFDFDKTGKEGIQDIPSNKEKNSKTTRKEILILIFAYILIAFTNYKMDANFNLM